MKSLAIGFIILGLVILATVSIVVVFLLTTDSEKTNISSTTTTSTTTATTTIQDTRCFYPDFAFQQRIVGGVEAESNIPWQVLIFINNEFMCGGTILDPMTILSAAHCFEKPYSPSIILAGSTNYVNSSEDTYQVGNFLIPSIIFHAG